MVCVENQRKIVQEKPKNCGEAMEEERSKFVDKATVGLVNYEEHMEDHHEWLKLILNKAWAENQSNNTKGSLLDDWGELDAPLQSL